MSSSSDFPSVATQKLSLSDDLNSTLLYAFLVGAYSMIFAFTIYVYTTNKIDRSVIVTAVLWALFAINITEFGIQWSIANECFINNGQTMLQAYICDMNPGKGSLIFTSTALSVLQYILADGLLLWRCYHITGRSLVRLFIPIFFLMCEIGSGIAVQVASGLFFLQPAYTTQRMANISQTVTAVFNVMTALATISSTFYICRQISTSSQETQHNRRYKKIIYIAIESSLIYAISSILIAITSILSVAPNVSVGVSMWLDDYVDAVAFVATGMAPTLMVAQISLFPSQGSSEFSNTSHISNLQFGQDTTTRSAACPGVDDGVTSSQSDLNDKLERAPDV